MSTQLTIIDYGMGNVHNVVNAFRHLGQNPVVSGKAQDIESADALVLPGVGAFGDCMENLDRAGLPDLLRRKIGSGTPFLGICLGLQALLDSSEESPGNGLAVFKGTVRRFQIRLHVPHMGWNTVRYTAHGAGCPLFKGIPSDTYFYFVHSYYADPASTRWTAALTPYEIDFCSAVWKENVFALQFHPEKSQDAGQTVLENFLSIAR